jgi:CheY-like chemotaxis protein
MNTLTQSTKQILIVDDDAQVREGLAMAMEAAGHDVRTVENGVEALDELRTYRPDVILLDLVMPTMDGWTFRLQQLRNPALASIPVVVLAARRETPRPENAPPGDDVLEFVGEVLEMLDEEATT